MTSRRRRFFLHCHREEATGFLLYVACMMPEATASLEWPVLRISLSSSLRYGKKASSRSIVDGLFTPGLFRLRRRYPRNMVCLPPPMSANHVMVLHPDLVLGFLHYIVNLQTYHAPPALDQNKVTALNSMTSVTRPRARTHTHTQTVSIYLVSTAC